MILERYFVEGLAHASYLFGADGEAAVVDPKRDVDDYLAAAERHGARLVAIFETHPHADFVSGHLELAQRTGAPVYISELAPATYERRALRDGEEIRVGPLRVRALATPGHSPDSMSFYVEGGEPPVLFSGDTLFVGDVGRPDLRDATADPTALADALYETLREVLFRLPDETLVYPAHGAGSLCGRQIGTAPATTIAAEKATNWATRFASREEFVAAMLANLPDRPAYFAYDVQMNLRGARPLAEVPKPRKSAPEALPRGEEALVLDLRSPDDYGAAHLEKSLNIGVAVPVFSTWVGFFVPPEQALVLVADRPEEVATAWLELARIGYERALHWLPADPDAWRAAGLRVTSTPQIEADCLELWLNEGRPVLDVRTPGEWQAGKLEPAQLLTLSQLPGRLAEVPAGPVALLCGTGYRSSLAAGLLERAGRGGGVNVRGGWAAWSGRPEREPDASDLVCRQRIAAAVGAQ